MQHYIIQKSSHLSCFMESTFVIFLLIFSRELKLLYRETSKRDKDIKQKYFTLTALNRDIRMMVELEHRRGEVRGYVWAWRK